MNISGEPVVNVLSIQSYDFTVEDQDGYSKQRIRAAGRMIAEGIIPKNVIMLWPQGYQKKNPTYQHDDDQQSLGGNLAEYAKSKPEFKDIRSIAKPISWTTSKDIEACIQMVKEEGYKNANFHFVTDGCHMWRVWLIWSLLHPKGWNASFYSTPKATLNLFERLVREPAAWLKDFIVLLMKKLTGVPPKRDTDSVLASERI